MLETNAFYIFSIPVYILLFILWKVKKKTLGEIGVFTPFFVYVVSLLTVVFLPIPFQ